ncbi:MAG: trigger factor [Candidatus Latescibacterota bacterium]
MDDELTQKSTKERKFTVSISSPSECKRMLSIEVTAEELRKEEAVILQKYRKELKVPGFRQGKVPSRFIEKNYGDAIHSDAVQNLLPVVYDEALRDNDISPLGEPKFENMKTDEEGKVSVDITVEVAPKVTVSGYENLEIDVTKKEIGEAETQEVLDKLREGFATLKAVEREARPDDYLVIDLAPLLESGEINEKEIMKNYPVDLSSGSLFEEFQEGLLGMTLGDEKNITVHYPESFPDPKRSGKDTTFHVSLREIKEKVLPDIDDEFAKKLGAEVDGLESLKDRIRKDLIAEEEKRYEREIEEKMIDRIIEKNSFEVPDIMVENFLTSLIEEDRRKRPSVESEAEREREIRKIFHEMAVRNVRKYFILIALKKEKDFSVSAGELEDKINEIVDNSGEKAEEVTAYFKQKKPRTNLESQLQDEKVFSFLRENAVVKGA